MPAPIEQLLSQTVYDTDGTTTVWDFSFASGYLDPSHVKAYTTDAIGARTPIVVTEPMLIGEFQLEITPALADNLVLTIYRETPKDAPLVNFTDESGFSEIALDTNAKQAVFIAAEAADLINTSTVGAALTAAALASEASSIAAAAADAAAIAAISAEGAADAASTSASNSAASAAASMEAVGGVVSDLASPTGAATVGADDGAAGTLFTTVQGALFWLASKWMALSSSIGASLVGFLPAGTGAVATNIQAKLRESVSVKDFGAVGDGVTNDDAEFALLEASHVGKVIDLCGLTYAVTTVPKLNSYTNGSFKDANGTLPALPVFNPPAPRFHAYGGQLRKLRESLTNPLHQFVGVVFIGDSITWGRTLPENAIFDPRDGTLSDPRDNFASPSFVNLFKRHIGLNYADNNPPTLTNWSASPSGEAIATYQKTNALFPKDAPFTFSSFGASITATEVASTAALLGVQWYLADGNVAGTSWQKISFPFTGTTFDLVFSVVDSSKCDYELIVDGVSQGLFGTGVSDGYTDNTYQNRRTHTFNFVDNKTIEIKTNRAAYASGTRTLRVEAIEIPKKIRVTNQGINGSSCRVYDVYNLSGSFGDGIAVGVEDSFVFVQLGTNDRIHIAGVPDGVQGFRRNLTRFLNVLIAICPDVVLMCALPAENNAAPTYTMSMQAVRGALVAEAKSRSLDFIDNYAIFDGAAYDVFAPDGVHPNARGHQRIALNIISSLESA